jgi:hypothetical protein
MGGVESEAFMKKEKNHSFAVGNWGAYECEWFLLIKNKNNKWYAWRDDCDQMCQIESIKKFNYEMAKGIVAEFKERSSN